MIFLTIFITILKAFKHFFFAKVSISVNLLFRQKKNINKIRYVKK